MALQALPDAVLAPGVGGGPRVGWWQALRKAGLLVFQIINVLLLACLLLSRAIEPQTLARARWLRFLQVPPHHCALCGMTRAFCRISRGDLAGARAYNRHSVALCGAFVLSIGVGCALAPRTRALLAEMRTPDPAATPPHSPRPAHPQPNAKRNSRLAPVPVSQ